MTIREGYHQLGPIHPPQKLGLLHYEGASVISPDAEGTSRYVYSNARLDSGSTVDVRTPHVLITEEQRLIVGEQFAEKVSNKEPKEPIDTHAIMSALLVEASAEVEMI